MDGKKEVFIMRHLSLTDDAEVDHARHFCILI